MLGDLSTSDFLRHPKSEMIESTCLQRFGLGFWQGLEAELAATQRLLKVVAGLLGTTQGIPKEERANKFK